jgi:hypothetical protein
LYDSSTGLEGSAWFSVQGDVPEKERHASAVRVYGAD